MATAQIANNRVFEEIQSLAQVVEVLHYFFLEENEKAY
jgi:hypothetical protein